VINQCHELGKNRGLDGHNTEPARKGILSILQKNIVSASILL